MSLSLEEEESDSSSGSFLWLTDFHYDPYFGRENAFSRSESVDCSAFDVADPRYGCDAPLSLVVSAIANGKHRLQEATGYDFDNDDANKDDDPPFVLVSGDFSRHATDLLTTGAGPRSELSSIIKQVAGALTEAFPSARVIPCVGNNDFTPDYYLDTSTWYDEDQNSNNPQLDLVADAFRDSMPLSAEEERTFRRGGYFARNVDDTLTILSLNTIVYSVYHEPKDHTNDDPLGQMAWMAQQFQRAPPHRRFYLLGHVPPTVGSYERDALWQERYRHRFDELIRRYQQQRPAGQPPIDVILGQLYGHQHSDEFRLLPGHTTPLLCGGSVTEIFKNNPSFRIVTYDKPTYRLLDYTNYYYDDNDELDPNYVWKRLYSFRDTYGVDDLSIDSVGTIVGSIEEHIHQNARAITTTTVLEESNNENPTLTKLLSYHYQRGQEGPQAPYSCDVACQFSWICVLTSGAVDDYRSCVRNYQRNIGSSSTWTKMLHSGQYMSLIALMLGGLYYALGIVRRMKDRAQYRIAQRIVHDFDFSMDDEEEKENDKPHAEMM